MPELRDPNSIIVRQELRQRQRNLNYEDIKASISAVGQINPITIRFEDGEGEVLVAGWRRLKSCIDLGIPVRVERWEDLSSERAKEIELEENAKRSDLHWRDNVRTIGQLHEIYGKTQLYTAERLSIAPRTVWQTLFIYKSLDSDLLVSATSADHAFSILERAAERRTAQIVSDIMASGAEAFGDKTPEQKEESSYAPTPENPEEIRPEISQPASEGELRVEPDPEQPQAQTAPEPAYILPTEPIILADFISWSANYIGPKFNLIHVDFPYGIKFDGNMGHESDGIVYESSEEIYWKLLNAFIGNFDRFCSYHAHVMFWFDMNFYTETKRMLETTGLFVQPKPLIWHKTDDKGVIPGRGTYPRHVYESAFLCVRARRPLIKHFSDAYGAPTASPAIHPSQKPEPVLRYFFSGLVDETTDILDPTCGSGTSIRAAEDLGARSVLGLELNSEYMNSALAETKRSRIKRQMRG